MIIVYNSFTVFIRHPAEIRYAHPIAVSIGTRRNMSNLADAARSTSLLTAGSQFDHLTAIRCAFAHHNSLEAVLDVFPSLSPTQHNWQERQSDAHSMYEETWGRG